MSKVVMDIYSAVFFVRDCQKRTEPNSDTWHTIENIILCDQIILDDDGANMLGIKDFLEENYPGVFQFENLLRGTEYEFTNKNAEEECFYYIYHDRKTESFLNRAVGYLDAAQKHNVYWSLHPSRAAHLKKALQVSPNLPPASQFVEYVDDKMSQSDAVRIIGYDVNVPPVVDQVVLLRAKEGIPLNEAIYQIREADHTKQFRKWAGQLDEALLHKTRSNVMKVQEALVEIDQVCKEWVYKHVGSGVLYKKRKISLRELPFGIGAILKVVDSGQFVINDPILIPEKPHLLFLNDLYCADN